MSWCWTYDPEELSVQTVFQTVKHGGGEIMIWGIMYIHGPGLVCKLEGHINQHYYREILEQNVCRMIQNFHFGPFSCHILTR